MGDLIIEGNEKDKVLKAFFSSVFARKTRLQAPETRLKCRIKEDVSFMKEDRAREHFIKLGMHKSMGPVEVHPKVLRELADITAKPLSKFCG